MNENPTLEEYIILQNKDDNFFWRLSEGAIQNLLDEAFENLKEYEALFDLQHRRLMMASKAWQDETGNKIFGRILAF